MSPRVCIDCSPLLVRSAGVKTYLYHLVRGLQELEPEAVRTFLAPGDLSQLDHGGGPGKHLLKLAALGLLSRLPSSALDAAIGACDVFHCSNLLRNAPRRARLTATIHDLTAWLLPECHTQATIRADREFAERVLRRADGIVAVSENTKRDAIRLLGIPSEKIRVIYQGVAETYFSVTPERIRQVKDGLGLTRPYFLFVGTIEPRKNVDTLLDAWEAMPADFHAEHELIIAGSPGWNSEKTMSRLRAVQDHRSVRYLGYVNEPDLPALTAAARAFVYPSLYEGFGIPVAQAMACGCAVIASNVSSLPEVLQGTGTLIDPRSASELRQALDNIPGPAARQAARERASTTFRWGQAAREHLDFLNATA